MREEENIHQNLPISLINILYYNKDDGVVCVHHNMVLLMSGLHYWVLKKKRRGCQLCGVILRREELFVLILNALIWIFFVTKLCFTPPATSLHALSALFNMHGIDINLSLLARRQMSTFQSADSAQISGQKQKTCQHFKSPAATQKTDPSLLKLCTWRVHRGACGDPVLVHEATHFRQPLARFHAH